MSLKMAIWDIEKTGAALLREYRDYEVRKFHLEKKLEEEIENFIYSFIDYPLDLLVFFNDAGKYIIIETWSRKTFFTEEMITRFCEKYNVTYEGVTTEIHTDYEENKSIGKITYLFEIIK